MSNHKTPTEKRTDGEVYNYEKKKRHDRENASLVECKKNCKRIIHIVKNPHDLIEKRVIQIVKNHA
jgi:hypothetical protein